MYDIDDQFLQLELRDIPLPLTNMEAKKRYRKTEKGRASRRTERKNKAERDYLIKPFIAWDGEGVTRIEGQKQDYVLFANSNGEALQAGRSKYLSTIRIFEFALTRNKPGTINVIYGAGYDWNMWLRDVPRETLEVLYSTGEVAWAEYWIKWRPGKTFHLGRRGTKESVLFYDVVSFFQRAFIKACDEYLGDDFRHRDLIIKNKRLRGSFTETDLAEIARYCDAELENLVSLMNELRERLYRVGLKVSRWDGPGAIAVALFREHGVKDHLRRTEQAESLAVRMAYFGGRFEVCKTGYQNSTVYEYDVNSAYPWALQDVPSMAGGTWSEEHGFIDPGTDFVLYYVHFAGSVMNDTKPYPLPHRLPNGNVVYSRFTSGWYWGPEVFTAQKYVKMYGGSLIVEKTRIFTPATDEKPFAFIGPIYTQRLELKRAKDGAQVGIKLGLNSLYGKLAQQVGWAETREGLRLPPYHQLEWAGYATSRCRAAVYGAVLQDLDSVVAFETDAMFTTRRLAVSEGELLGQWGYESFDDMAYLQSGTYFAQQAGEAVEKSRGVDRGELTYDLAMEALRSGTGTVSAKLTRFNGLGIALAQKFSKWLVWETMTKNVSIFPGAKRTHVHEMCTQCASGATMTDRFHETYPYFGVERGTESTPFPIEWETVTETGTAFAELRRENIERRGFDD